MSIAFTEHDVAVWQGDALEQLTHMPAGSVQCAVTSPPYFGLRDYGVDGQLGLESSPAEYVARMVAVFAEVRRVLAADGVLWLNLGDSYASSPPGKSENSMRSSTLDSKYAAGTLRENVRAAAVNRTKFLPSKNLLGMPWRVAFALQDDGWILRNAVVWHKPNAMPESVTDRLSTRYELVFLFSRSRRYWFDLDAIREGYSERVQERQRYAGRAIPPSAPYAPMDRNDSENSHGILGLGHRGMDPRGRNPGDVWSIPTSPYGGAHYACMPPALAERCIKAGCPPGGTVLDMFAGSGTTLAAARKLGCKSIGIELNPANIDLIRARIGQAPLEFDDDAAPIIGLEPGAVQDGFDFGEAAL
jgi:DNA modification methylase